ncbi:arsenate reductase (glutaredoxin) [Thalassococcus sp. BH17M4-6]|uniref:arsenate reductase (glutaredoxin) n=1 Tax=Thalassococcus sp. BH17M4-6 TaxID=3413148 RepID=UPI003BC1FEA1
MITFWHNPRCSKSRQALTLLQDHGAEVTVRRYLADAPDLGDLRAVQARLGVPALQMIRTGEAAFKAMELRSDSDDDTLLRAMAEVPKLIERPIAILGDRAVIGRPPEAVLGLLDDPGGG